VVWPTAVVQVVHRFTAVVTQHNYVSMALRPLYNAALYFSPRDSCLSPVAADFLQVGYSWSGERGRGVSRYTPLSP
jgi:hypothetical protein